MHACMYVCISICFNRQAVCIKSASSRVGWLCSRHNVGMAIIFHSCFHSAKRISSSRMCFAHKNPHHPCWSVPHAHRLITIYAFTQTNSSALCVSLSLFCFCTSIPFIHSFIHSSYHFLYVWKILTSDMHHMHVCIHGEHQLLWLPRSYLLPLTVFKMHTTKATIELKQRMEYNKLQPFASHLLRSFVHSFHSFAVVASSSFFMYYIFNHPSFIVSLPWIWNWVIAHRMWPMNA